MTTFERDIRPLFRQLDIQSMASRFDLRSYEAVKANASAIYARLADGSMPCDGAWSADQVARFERWMQEGYPP